jgi:hypothetical protein
MKKFDILSGLTRTFYKTGFKFKKHSPEVLVVTGAITMVASTITACRATTKLGDVLDQGKKDIEIARNTVSETDGGTNKKELAKAYAHTGLRVARLYAPSVALSIAGMGLIFKSHNILRNRNIALAAAYASIDNSFKKYRKNVVERFGEELDKELRYDIKTEEVEETIVDDKGKKKTVKKTVQKAVRMILANSLSALTWVASDGPRIRNTIETSSKSSRTLRMRDFSVVDICS